MLTKEYIIKLLEVNDTAICRALVVLNERQTSDEQIGMYTSHANGRGFRPCHARMGSSMANFYQNRKFLSNKQIAYWRKKNSKGVMRIAIYAGQLLEVAKENNSQKTVATSDQVS